MKPIATALAAAFVCLTLASPAWAEMITKKSSHGVTQTLDRLERVLKEKEIMVAARVDHTANAQKVGMILPPTQLLIFGQPKHGTQLMQVKRSVGLDLPMKVLAWEDAGGQTWVGYTDPAGLAKRHGIDPEHEVIQTMTKGLDKLTDAATGQSQQSN